MSADEIAAFGALFSGLGSLIGGMTAMWLQRRRGKNECDKRVAEVHRSFVEGMKMERREWEKRWAHLA